MASHATTLLRPRPDFLGAGWRRENTNLFLELSQLSGIYLEKSANDSQNISLGKITPTPEIAARRKIFTTKMEITTRTSAISNEKADDAKHCKSKQTKTKKLDEETIGYLTKAENIDFNYLEELCMKGKIQNSLKEDAKSEIPLTNLNEVNDQQITGKNGYIKFNDRTLEIFQIFDKLKIPYETEIYRPKEQRSHVDPMIFYCKNVFLKDRKGQFYLVICHEDIDLDLKELRKNLKAYRNFNFVTADEMFTLVKTEPGGVTPLALLYDTENLVKMGISNTLVQDGASLMFHPMDANMATKITLPGLLRYLRHVNHKVQFLK